MDGTNPKSIEELKENQECVKKISEILEPYSERIKELHIGVDRNELIRYFRLDSDDPDLLEEALKAMWGRVGDLQNAVTAYKSRGMSKEAFEYESEIKELRQLRIETRARIDELRKK